MLSAFEQAIIGITLIAIMSGMGASLRLADFKDALRTPGALLAGVACQFGIMPLIGFALAKLLGLSDDLTIGLMILACMPGGTTSNMFTYFGRGNLALSLSMTVTSTALGIVIVPLIISLYTSALNVTVPIDNVVQTLVLILVPVLVGMGILALSASAGRVVELIGAGLACFLSLF